MHEPSVQRTGSPIRKLFVLDCAGALTSAVLLGVVLVRLEHVFGMPAQALYVLAALPVGFACYSLVCGVTGRADDARFLRGLALLNLGYCVISAAYMASHASSLRPLGWAYFVGELAIVLGLAAVPLCQDSCRPT